MNTATAPVQYLATAINITATRTKTNETLGVWSTRNLEGWTEDGRSFTNLDEWTAAVTGLAA
jgi:hypothetical protein